MRTRIDPSLAWRAASHWHTSADDARREARRARFTGLADARRGAHGSHTSSATSNVWSSASAGDGGLGPRERHRLDGALDRSSRHIHRARHNGRVRE
jgi:hypothetical protein